MPLIQDRKRTGKHKEELTFVHCPKCDSEDAHVLYDVDDAYDYICANCKTKFGK